MKWRPQKGGHVKTAGETGVLQPQGKECLEPPEVVRDKEKGSPTAFRHSEVLWIPWFQTSSLTAMKGYLLV